MTKTSVFDKRPVLLASFAACLLGLLTSCANSSTGEALERSFAADPKLRNNSTTLDGSPQGNSPSQTTAKLPEDFPSEIPLYPNATLENVEPLTVPNAQGEQTSWSSTDPINAIQSFYTQEFESNNWQITSQPTDEAGGTFVARRNSLQVTVTIPSSAATNNSGETSTATEPSTSGTSNAVTEFEIQYIRNQGEAASEQSGQDSSQSEVPSYVPSRSAGEAQDFTDLDKAPKELRQYIEDLATLGVLTVDSSGSKTNAGASGTTFEPNKTITRREYARWLVAANNQIYANRPGQQIRSASETTQPAFRDVPRSDRDFQSIQALAEAGLIPSPLTGDATAVLFRPDAPLTRENLILWKVPLDTRQSLPSASVDAVKQTWGFQDAAKVEPKALRAVLADFQNGESANIRRMLGYTTLFQPKKPVTRAEAASVFWYFGSQGEGLSAKEAQQIKREDAQPSETPTPSPSSSGEQ
ncbi:S-layer homology domain-containing protein [Microcoleus sp. FACHB-SPT15]|uniref:S-layer homology domain-containing protein n=1 Tax=Microcoleus sp. FACHB-SPT15 TaxID=2692830 RepID=UPI0018EFCE50|nr:S-layer homology domain-containing protein [Microcoleus sp. FACHB-SPT15]